MPFRADHLRTAAATVKRIPVLAATMSLAACGGGVHRLVPDSPVKIGRPYSVNGRSYAPYDDTRYDRIGEASWYGNAEQGRHTASGEIFYRQRVSAAHTTLPLPSYVEITRLDTGRRILVRINDRGPYARDRIIDLSEAAARQLGIDRAGRAMVRVRRVTPSGHDRETLRRGYPVMLADVTPTATPLRTARPVPAASLPVTPPVTPPVVFPAGAPPGADYLPEAPGEAVQPASSVPAIRAPTSSVPIERDILVAMPSDPDAADALASSLGAEHGHVLATGAGYRVVTGPYPDDASRAAALARLRSRGYQGAAALDAQTANPSEATGSPLP